MHISYQLKSVSKENENRHTAKKSRVEAFECKSTYLKLS